MNYDKKTKAGRLFDAVGSLDDFFVTEAALYRKKNSFSGLFGWIAVGLAAFLIFFAVVPAVIIGSFTGKEYAPIDSSYCGKLAGYLTSHNDDIVPCSAESIDLFDGEQKVIWKTIGEEGYRTAEILLREKDLKQKIANGYRERPSEEKIGEYENEVYVWISLGDGRVITPYLKYSEGNVGYGEIFEYEPEIIPSDSLSLMIENSISA